MGAAMKSLIYSLLFVFAALAPLQAIAQADLETDDRFFKSEKNPYEEDDLDRQYKQKQSNQNVDQLKTTDTTVKGEVTSTAPDMMSSSEAAMIDQRVVEENKRRQRAIMSTVSSHGFMVKECIDKNRKGFQGSQITLAWLIAPNGQVLNADIKNTDIENPDIQNCVKDAALKLDFSSAAYMQYKKSLVEYTYRVKVKSRTPSSYRRVHQASQ